MILFVFGLMFALLWYIADRNLKDQFLPYLKWPAAIFICIFLLTDVYLQIETGRMMEVRKIYGNAGLGYSYFDNVTNSTVASSMYGVQDIDSGTLMAYHKIEAWTWEDITGLLPYLGIMMALGAAFQVLWTYYIDYTGGKR